MKSLLGWIDARMPSLGAAWRRHASEYYVPKNLNAWYELGSLAGLVLVLQLASGIFLAMHYKPDAGLAFASVERIMRDVPGGWVIRYMHSTGASAFFVVIYLHMFRALLYGSHKAPRELVWILGALIYLTLMAEAFFGYLLPWGQTSYWGAQVIVNLFDAIPLVGPGLAVWIRGDYLVSDATLTRFFALHVVVLPLALLVLVTIHILALHDVGSGNPDGVDIKRAKDERGRPLEGIPFHPYYTVKDVFAAAAFLAVFAFVLFFAPEMGGYFLEADNFIAADPLKTPPHVVPLWYFTPYYAILRAVPPVLGSQFPGVAAMGSAVLVLFLLPWLDRGPVRSIRHRGPMYRFALAAFVVAFVTLGYLGIRPTTIWGQFGPWLGGADRAVVAARVLAIVYFSFFVLMPWYTAADTTRPAPARLPPN
jgi:ubiquinol-cytochrome c reductase cytochrome b subunit